MGNMASFRHDEHLSSEHQKRKQKQKVKTITTAEGENKTTSHSSPDHPLDSVPPSLYQSRPLLRLGKRHDI